MKRLLQVACLALVVAGIAVGQVDRSCPCVLELSDCQLTIERIKYDQNLDLGNVTMKESQPDKFRYATVMVRMQKPEGKAVSLAAADLTLHYRRDDGKFDVAPCEGLSSFTVARDEDRSFESFVPAGPGWVKQQTGAASRRASTIYFEAVFGKVERDANLMWLCVGQPGTPPYQTDGW